VVGFDFSQIWKKNNILIAAAQTLILAFYVGQGGGGDQSPQRLCLRLAFAAHFLIGLHGAGLLSRVVVQLPRRLLKRLGAMDCGSLLGGVAGPLDSFLLPWGGLRADGGREGGTGEKHIDGRGGE